MTQLRSFDRVAHVYDETRGMPPEVESQVADGIAAVLREIAPEPRLLEVGIGTGRIAAPLAARGVRVTGIDISPKMLSVLLDKRSDIDVMLGESTRPPLRASTFDAALFVHVLHLVPDAAATTRATLSLVRAGGAMIYGGDDRDSGIRERADAIIRALVKEIAGREIPDWKSYQESALAFEQVVTEAGAVLERRTLARWQGSSTAKRMLERLARKDYSSSWLIPDESLPAILERAGVLLDELYGDREREVPFDRSFSIVVGRLPV